MNMGFELYNY